MVRKGAVQSQRKGPGRDRLCNGYGSIARQRTWARARALAPRALVMRASHFQACDIASRATRASSIARTRVIFALVSHLVPPLRAHGGCCEAHDAVAMRLVFIISRESGAFALGTGF